MGPGLLRAVAEIIYGDDFKEGEATLVKLQGPHQKTRKPKENQRKTKENIGKPREKGVEGCNFTLAAPPPWPGALGSPCSG